jgi:putative alpha-1,2-mannosidase
LETWGIRAEFTVAKQAACYRFTFPASAHAQIALSLGNHAEFSPAGNNSIQGSARPDGTVVHLEQAGPETRQYFYAEFSSPLDRWRTWQGAAVGEAPKQSAMRLDWLPIKR